MIILDFGSGNTCKNDIDIIEDMINGLDKLSSEFKKELVIKWQLFDKAGDNEPLRVGSFDHAYAYAKEKGYKTTASVFDKLSLINLLYTTDFDIPFVKLANSEKLHYLAGYVPRDIPVFQSVRTPKGPTCINVVHLACISEYPAAKEDYEEAFFKEDLLAGLSDHTTDWSLFKQCTPVIYECHYKLPDSTGLDAGPFARTPDDLLELDNYLKEDC